jgi:hemin uptake protein HemP
MLLVINSKTAKMTPPDLEQRTDKPDQAKLATVSSSDLLAGNRQVIIQHGQEQYRLRLTNSNKLILTK